MKRHSYIPMVKVFESQFITGLVLLLLATSSLIFTLSTLAPNRVGAETVGVDTQAQLESAVADPTKTVIELHASFSTNKQIDINRTLVINGNGHTISPQFNGTGGGNDTVITVKGGSPTINNLVIDGSGATNLQGLQVWHSSATLSDITSRNNDKAGVHANSSSVNIINVTTSNNGANYGGILISGSGSISIDGQSRHSETSRDIWQDTGFSWNPPTRVNDTNDQYSNNNVLLGRVYSLLSAPTAPGFTAPTPGQDATVTSNSITISWTKPQRANSFEYRINSGEVIETNGQSLTDIFTNGEYLIEVRSVAKSGLTNNSWTARRFTVDAHPDPFNRHQMSVSGEVYKDHRLNDCYGLSSCYDRGENLGDGWVINLYKEANGNWEAVSTSETNNLGIFSFPAIKDAGVYHACMVTRVGWTQQTQNWSGTPYHIATNNLSGNTSEGPYCRTIDYSDTANYSNKFYFGNVDTQVPVGNAVYHGGIVIDNIIYIESIDDLSFTETIHDNHGVIRATYLVQKLNADSGNYEGFCGNWNKHSLGSHSLGGLTAEVHTINNIRNCASDTSTWTDGTYKIFHAGYDSTGNEGKFNTNRQIFTIDSTAPDAPVLGLKIDDNPVASGFITNKSSVKAIWNKPSLDTVKYEYEYWNDIVGNPYKELSPWRTVVLSENRQGDFTEGEGKHFIRVRAIDHIGNKSSWSNVFEITYDKTAPKVTINALPTSTLGNPTVSGTATEVSSIQLTIGDSLEVDIAVEDGVWTYTIPEEDSLTNGSYGVFANATDQAGNVAEPAMATLVIAIPDDTNEDSIDDSQIAPQEQSSSGVLGSSIGSSGSDSRTATQSPATNRTSRMHTTTPPTGYDANEVLAESDEVDSSELNRGAVQSELDEAKTLASSNTSEETDGCKTILGICWYYWIPVVIVAIVTTYYISRDSKNKD